MALERRRLLKRGVTSFAWCGMRDDRLVVPLAGAVVRVDLREGGAQFRMFAQGAEAPARDPACDRAGAQLAFVRGNDLWVQGLDDSGTAPRRLTQTGSETVSTGLADFIAAEEFDRQEGYWWSPDGRQLLAFEVDEAAVPVVTRVQIRAGGSGVTQQRYPFAGTKNARVVPLVIDTASGTMQRVALPAQAEYLLRGGWFDDGVPWLRWTNREQTELHLVELPDAAGPPRSLLVERDERWVESHDDLHEIKALPLSGRPALLWSSERSGRRQLWLVDRASGAQRALTDLPEPLASVVCAGSAGVVFAAAAERGRARELFLLDPATGHGRPLPGAAPQQWRSAVADRACTQLLVRTEAWSRPPQLSVLPLTGGAALPLPGEAPDPLLARIAPRPRALTFTAADGHTPLNALFLPPLAPSSRPGGHAVIVSAYGGPGVNTAAWRWRGDVPKMAHWQRLGFGILMFDGRGMADRDRDFTRAHWHAFGRVDVDDLFAVVRQLPSKVKGIDPRRIGFTGWSYGGFLGVRAVLDENTPLAAAVAGAPGGQNAMYDTAYTERYLGLPEGGAAPAYRQASLVARAARLSRPLMLMHGTADDNVLFESTLALVQALQAEGKLFETVIYPGQSHGLGDRKARLHRDRAETDFLVRHLRP
jgi:dipeptidyl-peptidase-4